MAVLAYCRASTAKQIASPETQKSIIRQYCLQKGLDFKEDWFVDPATSGKKPIGERPAGKMLLAHMKRGDHLVVARLDRLSRSFVNFGKILETCENMGVILHVCDAPGGELDPSNLMGRMAVHMVCCFADYERRLISIRTQEGLSSLKNAGHVFGPKAVYGYKKVRVFNRRLGKHISQVVPDEYEQKVLKKMLELRVKGWTYERIALWLNNEAGIRTSAGYEWDGARVWKSLKTAIKDLASHEYSATQEEVEKAISERQAMHTLSIAEEDPEEGEEEVDAG